jgi:hypothetical protein
MATGFMVGDNESYVMKYARIYADADREYDCHP